MNELERFKLPEDCMEHEWALQAADDVAKYTIKTIKAAPAVDAVPVVRCMDCWKRGGYHCPMFSEELESYDEDSSEWIEYDETVDNGYCERGEKIGR